MNRWNNNNLTYMIDIDKISYYKYTPVGNGIHEQILNLIIDGVEMILVGQDAEDLYNTINNQKQIV